MRENIPVEHRLAVYLYGLDPAEIVALRYLDPGGMKIAVKLRRGKLEWSGHLSAPTLRLPPPRIRVADLLDDTRDCPACRGSGKVPRKDTNHGR